MRGLATARGARVRAVLAAAAVCLQLAAASARPTPAERGQPAPAGRQPTPTAGAPGSPQPTLRAQPNGLLAPAEHAPHVVLGAIVWTRQLDAQGWSAGLRVERAFAGDARPGLGLRIAWEELSPSLAVRFAPGDRVLLALERLPDGSLWSARFPKRDALAVAARGSAFLRDPDAPTLAALAPFLALAPPQRSAPAGCEALALLARSAQEPLASEALAELQSLPQLAQTIPEQARDQLAALLADAQRPAPTRAAAVQLAAARKLTALAPALRKLAAEASPLGPLAVRALAELGVLSRAELDRYAGARDPALRVAVLRGAPRAFDAGALARTARSDRAAGVRAAALDAYAAQAGAGALDAAVDALGDDDAEVQAAALRALPAFPTEAARALRIRAFGPRADDENAMRPLLAGLAMVGRDGAAVLREIETNHPNAKVRALAQFLLGHTPEH